MKLTFNDPMEFEEFATAYVLGSLMLRGGGMLAAEFDPAKLAVGAIAEARAIMRHHEARAVSNDRQRAELAEEQLASPDGPGQTDEPSIGFPKEDLPAGSEELTFDPVTIPDEKTETQVEAPKRKRRTKAEIAADEAAAKAATPGEGNEPLTYSDPGSEDAVAEVAAIANQVATTAASIASDAEAKVQAARAVYTPELVETLRGHAELFDANRTEHLKEARDAISKKGFIPYNATMHGLGLGASIASYSDDEVKLHRAAIAHLLAS